MKYDTLSECLFVGTIQENDGEPYMNAIAVVPLHAKTIKFL